MLLVRGHTQLSAEQMDGRHIDIKALHCLQPLLSEMQLMQESLDKQEFIQSAMNLYQTLSPQDRQILMAFDPKARKAKGPEYTFKPVINRAS